MLAMNDARRGVILGSWIGKWEGLDVQAPMSPYPARISPNAAHKAERPQGSIQSMIL
jgi:hypothetical protein